MSFWLEEITTVLAVVIFCIMVVTVLLGVVYRYILFDPLAWSDELAVYCMIWIGYLGVGIALKYDEHPSLQFIVKQLPVVVKKILQWVVYVVTLIFLAVVTVWGFKYAIFSGKYRLSSGIGIKMTLPMLSVPIGCFLAVVYLILKLLNKTTNIFNLTNDEKNNYFKG